MFLDLVGSTSHWRLNSNHMPNCLSQLHKIVDEYTKTNDGFIVKTIGDAIMAVFFCDPFKAVTVCVQIQQNLMAYPWVIPNFNFRMGICYGEATEIVMDIQKCQQKDYLGATVNIASRMESKVSPSRGIGLCFYAKLPNTDLSGPLNEFSTFLQHNVSRIQPIHYVESTQDHNLDTIPCQESIDETIDQNNHENENGNGVKNSARLLFASHEMVCKNASKLHGVGPLMAYQFEVKITSE